MKPVTRIAGSLLIGTWAILTLTSHGIAQTTSRTPWPDAFSSKTDFEQRSVKGWRARQPGKQARQTQLSEAPPWPADARQATPWTGTRGVSMVLQDSTPAAGPAVEGPDVPFEDGSLSPAPTRGVQPPVQGAQPPAGPQQGPAISPYTEGPAAVDGASPPGYPTESVVAGSSFDGYYGEGYPGGWGPGAYWGPSPFRWVRNISLFGGVHAFKGPADFGRNGNFGIHEGIDWGGALGDPWGMGMQLGFQAAQSNFQGDQTDWIYANDSRNQIFVTAGLFRRNLFGGLQGGVAFDYMHDKYYYSADLKQVRMELAAVWPGWREIGFWGAVGVGRDIVSHDHQEVVYDDQFAIIFHQPEQYTLEPMSQLNFFYRQYFRRGGEGRVWVGLTNHNDFVFGGESWIPLGTHWALEGNFNFLVPNEAAAAGQAEESWGLNVQVVWYPGYSARASRNNPFRPLFRTADNAVFMTHRN